MSKYIFLIAYAYSVDGTRYVERIFIKPDAENIANFIMKHRETKVIITTELDLPYIEAEYGLVTMCTDKNFLLNELHPAIIPIQTGKKKIGIVKEYCEDLE